MATLLDYKSNTHSQCGEDGVIKRVFDVIGEGNRLCCEFGAWDGIYLSNTRALIERGWTGVFIEVDAERFEDLRRTYPDDSRHTTILAAVEPEGNTLGRILESHGINDELDLLSIDVDGEDYYILRSLDVRPRLICIETIYAQPPDSLAETPRADAVRAIGQPLALFAKAAAAHGYRLIAMVGTNTLFLREDVGHETLLPTLAPIEAYELMTHHLDDTHRIWLYLMNRGIVSPFYDFGNRWASAAKLGIPWHVAAKARFAHRRRRAHPSQTRVIRFVRSGLGFVRARSRRLLIR